MTTTAPRAPSGLAPHPVFERGVRLGYAARGLLYTIISVTALSVAFGRGGDSTGSSGALQKLSESSYGTVLLAAVAVGLGAYALWRLLQAFAQGDPDHSIAKTLWMRGYYGVRGVTYGFLCWSAVRILSGNGGGGEGGRQSMTRRVLELPGGQIAVGLVGVGVLGYGIWQGYRAISRRFEEELQMGRMDGRVERVLVGAGVAGYLGRMVVFGLIGSFLLQGAITYDASKAIGLDRALSTLAGTDFGPWLLAVVATGLLGFAVFSFGEVRYRRIDVEH